MFNKYEFLENLKEVILEAVEREELTDQDDIWDYIHTEIDNQCIYYHDCFEICKALGYTNWEDAELPVNNISQAAYNALYELINEEFVQDDIIEQIEEKQNQE